MKSCRQKNRGVLVFLLSDGESVIRNLAGVMRAAKELGWRTQIAPSKLLKDGNGLHFALAPTGGSVAELLDFWRPDGCIVIASGLVDEVPLELDGRFPTAFMSVKSDFRRPLASGVTTDEAAFARMAFRELVRSGYRDYAYVPWISDERWSRERGDAFARLVSGSGKRFHGFPGETGKTGEPASPGNAFRERLASWLQELPKPVGLFAANDAVASDVLKACTSLGLAVPGAVAVIGVDGQKWLCENTDPPLSSIAPDSEGMGVAAVELLAEMMDSPDRIFPLRRCGGTEVVRRETTRFENMRDWRVSRMLDAIRAHACDTGFSPRDAVRAAGISRARADDLFRAATGHTLLAEIHAVRLARARELLSKVARTDIVAFASGFASDDDFRRVFRRHFGTTPRKWALGQHQTIG